MKIVHIFFVILLWLTANTASADPGVNEFRTQFLNDQLSWIEVQQRAKSESEVHFYYWGGDDNLNIWINSVVSKDMKKQGITLIPHRITATKDVVDLALAEKNSGKGLGQGSVDVVWVNGENFYTLAQQDLLFGDFAQRLPESNLYEWSDTDSRSQLNTFDFGFETLGREMPWSGEQYVCAANRALLSAADTPTTYKEMESWLQENPGLFTYVKPPHYLGNTFVQQVLYEMNPHGTGAAPFQRTLASFTAKEFAELVSPGFEYLNRIAANLANVSNGAPRYPENDAALMNLFRNSEIAIECQFGSFHVANQKRQGKMPDSAEEIILPAGNMIKNKNYLALLGNASNPAASLVFINYMSSFAAQKDKIDLVGYPVGLDTWKLNSGQKTALDKVTPPHFGLSQTDLDNNIAPDTNASLINLIEHIWIKNVEQKSPQTIESIIDDYLSQ